MEGAYEEIVLGYTTNRVYRRVQSKNNAERNRRKEYEY